MLFTLLVSFVVAEPLVVPVAFRVVESFVVAEPFVPVGVEPFGAAVVAFAAVVFVAVVFVAVVFVAVVFVAVVFVAVVFVALGGVVVGVTSVVGPAVAVLVPPPVLVGVPASPPSLATSTVTGARPTNCRSYVHQPLMTSSYSPGSSTRPAIRRSLTSSVHSRSHVTFDAATGTSRSAPATERVNSETLTSSGARTPSSTITVPLAFLATVPGVSSTASTSTVRSLAASNDDSAASSSWRAPSVGVSPLALTTIHTSRPRATNASARWPRSVMDPPPRRHPPQRDRRRRRRRRRRCRRRAPR
ncbi:hypothetical protein [Halolamina litorea]|uniref:Uncharacterized protein n=1 Tax=Halolamina litorea TaxID=1515593 RepID=A0ABD6BPN9_9EURY|nr:hypothetical protein [Halolamina litorea]